MRHIAKRRAPLARATPWLLVATLLSGGCGSEHPASVTGTVTLNGGTIEGGTGMTGTVMYYPVGGGAAVHGQVTEGGKYQLKTGDTAGLATGEYEVTVRVVDIPPPPPGGHQNAPASTPLVPARYGARGTSDLRATVEPGDNVIDFDLTSPS